MEELNNDLQSAIESIEESLKRVEFKANETDKLVDALYKAVLGEDPTKDQNIDDTKSS